MILSILNNSTSTYISLLSWFLYTHTSIYIHIIQFNCIHLLLKYIYIYWYCCLIHSKSHFCIYAKRHVLLPSLALDVALCQSWLAQLVAPQCWSSPEWITDGSWITPRRYGSHRGCAANPTPIRLWPSLGSSGHRWPICWGPNISLRSCGSGTSLASGVGPPWTRPPRPSACVSGAPPVSHCISECYRGRLCRSD